MLIGKVLKLGDNINTDDIIAGQYLRTNDPLIWKKHIFETIDPQLSTDILQMKFIIAGDNFGCGSSREQAVIAIKSCGISAIIANSFARIFYRNCINNGLLVATFLDVKAINIVTNDEVRLNISNSLLFTPKNKVALGQMVPLAMKIYESGGLLQYYRKQHDGQ